MQRLAGSGQAAATLASEAGAPVGTKHAASGREWSGGGTTLAIAQQFLTISKVILGPAAPAAPRHGQVSGQAQVGNLWKPGAGQCHGATVGTRRVCGHVMFVTSLPTQSL